MDAGEFFDKNANIYGALKPKKYDYFFIDFISKHSNGCNLLDVGGGGGCFTKLCQEYFETVDLCIVDPSKELLQKQKLKNIKTVVGKLPDELNLDEKFDYIHIKEVLHHVTGSSTKKSKDLFVRSLINLKNNNLSSNGFILIHELFYESYLFPTFTRTMIFYLLKLQNRLRIKVPIKDFIDGLDVCFYTRDELKSIFKETGFQVVEYYEESWNSTPSKRMMLLKKSALLKNWGSICFVIQNVNKTFACDSGNIATN